MRRRVIVLVRQNGLGHVATGDADFGVQMFDRFLHALEPQAAKPEALCFYTEGVRLVCSGSPVVESLQLLQGMGVRMVACGTCLERYGLREKVVVGEIGTMHQIVEMLMTADSVVTI
jgi:sulfur relay (sulfurtransferase) complex TusBCD TusD component (DsrE family)